MYIFDYYLFIIRKKRYYPHEPHQGRNNNRHLGSVTRAAWDANQLTPANTRELTFIDRLTSREKAISKTVIDADVLKREKKPVHIVSHYLNSLFFLLVSLFLCWGRCCSPVTIWRPGSTTSRAGSSADWDTWKDPSWPLKVRCWWRRPTSSTRKESDSSDWERLWSLWDTLMPPNHSWLRFTKPTTPLRRFRQHLAIKQLIFPLFFFPFPFFF